MLLGVSLHEILWLALALVVGGMIPGVLAGLFGVSGGSVIVPVLYEVFRVLGVPEDVRMQLCLGTSIAIVVPTTIRSYLTHRSKGAVIPGVIRRWALPAVIGVACSAVIASFAPAAVLTVAFVLVASFIALKLLFAGDRWNLGNELPGPLPMTLYGFGIGFFGSLMGVSGGAISTIILTVYGKPIHNAVATSSGVAVPITIAGAIGFMLAGLPHQAELPSLGFVSLIGLAVTAPVASYVAPLRRASRAPAAAPHARSRLRLFSARGIAAVSGELVLRLLVPTFPGRGATRSGAPQIRDSCRLRVRCGPGSAAHHQKRVHARLRALWCCAAPGTQERYGYPCSSSRSPRTSQLCSRLRKLMPRRLVLSWTATRSSRTGAACVRPLAVSITAV
jgi:uncharacterized membrane protein YfcA